LCHAATARSNATVAGSGLEIGELWRFPIKSLRGERLDEAEIRLDGVVGDRLVHVREASGRVVTARYRPRLLGLNGTLGPDGEPLIDGRPWGHPESLAAVRRASSRDVELVRFAPPDRGQRFDVLPLTVLTDGAAEAAGFDHRRFRANLFLHGAEGLTERDWVGKTLHVGDVEIGVRKARSRCVMTTIDPDTGERDPEVLNRIVRDFGGFLALDCWVIEPGHVRVGDAVHVESEQVTECYLLQ
jgi:uncharacterized protein YcbX